MLLVFWNKCDSMVTPSGFYLLNTITNFLFPNDPAAISGAERNVHVCFALTDYMS